MESSFYFRCICFDFVREKNLTGRKDWSFLTEFSSNDVVRHWEVQFKQETVRRSLSTVVRYLKCVQKATLILRSSPFAKSPLKNTWSYASISKAGEILPTQFSSGDQTNTGDSRAGQPAMFVQTMTQRQTKTVQFKEKRFVKWNKIERFLCFSIRHFTKIKVKTSFTKEFLPPKMTNW